jgi:hypothetical protein
MEKSKVGKEVKEGTREGGTREGKGREGKEGRTLKKEGREAGRKTGRKEGRKGWWW